MNERIRELFLQADFPKVDIEAEAERFAELIVKECIRLCDQVDLAGADDCMDKIKDHFGVEESKGWVCSNCGTDRTKQECPKGYTAALTGECPMIGVAQ